VSAPGAVAVRDSARGTARLRRGLAMLLLPASIVPVLFLGPALLRAPGRLSRQAASEIQRLAAPAAHAPRDWLVSPTPAEAPGLSPAVRRGAGLPATRRAPR